MNELDDLERNKGIKTFISGYETVCLKDLFGEKERELLEVLERVSDVISLGDKINILGKDLIFVGYFGDMLRFIVRDNNGVLSTEEHSLPLIEELLRREEEYEQ